mgnify:CR=1 FL=1
MNHANDQQIVLVTGALGRLGKTFSKFIVNSDALVFLVDQSEEKGQQFVVELKCLRRCQISPGALSFAKNLSFSSKNLLKFKCLHFDFILQ